MTDEEIRLDEENEISLGPFKNFRGCDYTIQFSTNKHPLILPSEMYYKDFPGFNFFYNQEWFLVKNCEILTPKDFTMINEFIFFSYTTDNPIISNVDWGHMGNPSNRLFDSIFSVNEKYFLNKS